MPQTTCVLVRVAVLVPVTVIGQPADAPTLTCPFCHSPCLHTERPATPLAPGVTVEMAAFFREHPDSN
jgi:hypothetical protein